MRPSGKLKLWTGGYLNQPTVNPPLFLRLLMVLCSLSLVGTLVYAVFLTLGHFGVQDASLPRIIVQVFVLFILPFVILYSISTNNPGSRYLIVFYFALATFAVNQYFPGFLEDRYTLLHVGYILFVGATTLWLFVSANARIYYALVSRSPVPQELEHLVDQFGETTRIEILLRRLWDILEPLSPIVILLLAILLVIAGFRNISP